MCVCVCVCVRACVRACMRVCVYACMRVCVYACMRVCMYIYISCLSIFIYKPWLVNKGGLNMRVAYPMNFISRQK